MGQYEPGRPLLSRPDLEELAESIASVNATAELLGRVHVRRRAERVTNPPAVRTFADDGPFPSIPEPVPIFRTPVEAVDYFTGLVPSLGIDPLRFAGEQRRKAFTLAASTNDVLTRKVQDAIAEGLKANQSTAAVTKAIEDRLKEFGAIGRSPQYSEMVWRTNIADAYQTGVYEEGRDPDVSALFPVWQYVGIDDNRTGDDHRPNIDRFYPAHATFADVRGPRPFNCRCGLRWVDVYEWAEWQAKGKQVETRW